MPDIKNLLDSIIDNTDNSYTIGGMSSGQPVPNTLHPKTFDTNEFREKLSLYVLKDLVCAMMHDETKDLDNMIDESIQRHIHDDYKGTCYGYLTCARDRLKSPLFTDIIQEIDDAVTNVSITISSTKDPSVADNIDVKDLLKNVNNYDDFRNLLKDKVSEKVVNDVAKELTKGNEAPVFDDIDNKIKPVDNSNNVSESVIMRMCENIVTESYIKHEPITTEEGINRASIQYCISELDYLTKTNPSVSIYDKFLR